MEKWIENTELFGDTTTTKMFSNDSQETYLHAYYDSARGGNGIAKLLRRINKAKKDAQGSIKKKKDRP